MMGSKIAEMLKSDGLKMLGEFDINKDIKKDKKINKDAKNIINVKDDGGKKRGRPPKDPEDKKEKLNLSIEPRYRLILEKEAKEKGYDLGPYIVSEYIKEPLKKKYKNL